MSTVAKRRYVSLADAAEYLSVNPKTVRRMIASGTITGYRIGSRIRVDLDELDTKAVRPIPAGGVR